MDALKASPNPRKLKKAAQKVKADRKKSLKAEELKTPPTKSILKKKKDFWPWGTSLLWIKLLHAEVYQFRSLCPIYVQVGHFPAFAVPYVHLHTSSS